MAMVVIQFVIKPWVKFKIWEYENYQASLEHDARMKKIDDKIHWKYNHKTPIIGYGLHYVYRDD